ncbi:hypothetical protein [Companilactobacillus mishanensis]|uniref:DUF2746 domain-containing protein n=1 Tax=Companilactobacillus mishanensis TaxID=2486008 RepID=A0A5P0ZF40_9LACO|nr:hypothetical protein [Companilactobacillus mishanensis]MQS44233.1 hypothetical protein [Companilactobacillus mishanensis]MQS51662.1 hypothetical protein [Companilactobacillus mishanensis]
MIDTIKVIVSAVSGGALSGIFTVWLQKIKNQGSNEAIYARHTKELFERIDMIMKERDTITHERDELKSQVIILTRKIDLQNATIKQQGRIIDTLTKQVGILNEKFDSWREE